MRQSRISNESVVFPKLPLVDRVLHIAGILCRVELSTGFPGSTILTWSTVLPYNGTPASFSAKGHTSVVTRHIYASSYGIYHGPISTRSVPER